MAVTITRTPWIDDDGTGTTGTVINNAVKTALYNDIDGALAKLAQLAGGNTFTGAQTVTGTVTITGAVPITGRLTLLGTTGQLFVNEATDFLSCKITMSADPAIANGIMVRNISTTVAALPFYICASNAGAIIGSITGGTMTSVTFNTTSDARLKDDAGRATDVAALRAVVVHDFTWKADGVRDRGVFAQEAHALYPRAVSAGTDDTTADGSLARPWLTDYSKFVPDLIVGWQQHDAALADLRALLATVKGSH